MSTFVKVMVAMLLTLPLGAYVAGTLAGAGTDMPTRRAPVVLEVDDTTANRTPSPSPRPAGTRTPDRRTDDQGDDHGDDHGGRRDRDDRDEADDDRDDRDDDIPVVRPTPLGVDDDDDDRDDRDEPGDDRDDRDDDGGDDD